MQQQQMQELASLLQHSDWLPGLAEEFAQLKARNVDPGYLDEWMQQRLREFRQWRQRQPTPPSQQPEQHSAPAAQPPSAPAPLAPRQAPNLPAVAQPAQESKRGTGRPTFGLAAEIQAAMERDHRLALSAALARQQVALGIAGGPLIAALTAGHGGNVPPGGGGGEGGEGAGGAAGMSPALASALQADVLAATQKLAEQQATLLDMVRDTQEQLHEHKDLLASMLQGSWRQQQPSGGLSQPNPGAPHTLTQVGIAAPATAPPPPAIPRAWFIPPALQLQQQYQQQQQLEAASGDGTIVSAGQQGADVRPALLLPPSEPLHVRATLSPTGQLRKGKHQRKTELKAALRQVLLYGDAPRHPAASQAPAPLQGGHALGGGVAVRAQSERELVRSVLQRLLHGPQQQQRGVHGSGVQQPHSSQLGGVNLSGGEPRQQQDRAQHVAAAVARHPGEAAALPHDVSRWGAGGVGRQHTADEIRALEEEAAWVLQQDRDRERAAREGNTSSTWPGSTPAPYHADLHGHPHPHQHPPAHPGLESLLTRLQDATQQLQQQVERLSANQGAGAAASAGGGLLVGPGPAPATAAAAATPADNPVLVLHRVMAQLQRMEETENAIRRKWMGSQDGAGTNLPSASATQPQQQGTQSGASVSVVPAPQQVARPFEVAAGRVLPAQLRSALAMPQPQPGQQEPEQQLPGAGAAQGAEGAAQAGAQGVVRQGGVVSVAAVDPVASDVVESVHEARRRFLEHQALTDNLLLSASALQEAGLRPQDIVEDVADVLLDELLLLEAAGMLKTCDLTAEELYSQEFA